MPDETKTITLPEPRSPADVFRYPPSFADKRNMNVGDIKACPCLHTTPCHERCTCVMPVSSTGCTRCCTYGSAEQQASWAKLLAEVIDVGLAARLPGAKGPF